MTKYAFAFCLSAVLAALPAVAKPARESLRLLHFPSGDGMMMLAENPHNYPVYARFQADTLDNAVSAKGAAFEALIPAQGTIYLTSLSPVNPDQPLNYRFRYTFRTGDPRARHDPRAVYHLPFPRSQPVFVSQAHGGPMSSHSHPSQQHAVDIAMPNNTPIKAARSGRIIAVVDGFGPGRPDPRYFKRTNLVTILHEDGTWADYLHLQGGSITVKVDQWVEAGQQIARSGNSGYSSGPHLHFNVVKNSPDGPVSLPFFFTTEGGERFRARAGQILYLGSSNPLLDGFFRSVSEVAYRVMLGSDWLTQKVRG